MKNNLLYILSILVTIIGFGILCCFIYLLSIDYHISGNKMLLDKTGQVGDFVGGVVGSLWSLAGVLLIFITYELQKTEISKQREEFEKAHKQQETAINDQRKEFEKAHKLQETAINDQRKEFEKAHKLQETAINDQRKEFHINRITSIVYFQLEKIEKVIDNTPMTQVSREYNNSKMQFVFFAEKELSIHEIGNISQDTLSEMSSQDILGIAKKYDELTGKIKIHEEYILIILNALSNSINVLKSILAIKDLDVSELNSLKYIFFKNIGDSFLDIFTRIKLINDNYNILIDFVHSQQLNDESLEEQIFKVLGTNQLSMSRISVSIKAINDFRNTRIMASFVESQIN